MHRFMRRDAEAQVYEEEGAGARDAHPRKAYSSPGPLGIRARRPATLMPGFVGDAAGAAFAAGGPPRTSSRESSCVGVASTTTPPSSITLHDLSLIHI